MKEKKEGGIKDFLWIAFAVGIIAAVMIFWIYPGIKERESAEKSAQEISALLEIKYENVKHLISIEDFNEASRQIGELVHPSRERSTYKKGGALSDSYTYNEYWEAKRNELRQMIEDKKSGNVNEDSD